jgi:hypothetical protein
MASRLAGSKSAMVGLTLTLLVFRVRTYNHHAAATANDAASIANFFDGCSYFHNYNLGVWKPLLDLVEGKWLGRLVLPSIPQAGSRGKWNPSWAERSRSPAVGQLVTSSPPRPSLLGLGHGYPPARTSPLGIFDPFAGRAVRRKGGGSSAGGGEVTSPGLSLGTMPIKATLQT